MQILCLTGLSAIGAELLAAYADNTGNIAAVLFALVFFAALYGAPALLARELVRRAGWGWPSLLLLTLALGMAQACLIDQSLFAEDYFAYEGWAESRQAAFIPALSISASQALNFILGHVIFSFAAPIAIAEAWRPRRAMEPWLGSLGITTATIAYLGVALLIAFDPESRNASIPQFITSAALVIGCVLAAWLVGNASRTKAQTNEHVSSTSPTAIFAMTLPVALLLASDVFGEGWLGVVFNATLTAVVGGLLWWRAQRPGWTCRHIAAMALAFLFSRGVLAFTYFPLVGQVDPTAKYAHNVVMIVLVLERAHDRSLSSPSRLGSGPMGDRRSQPEDLWPNRGQP